MIERFVGENGKALRVGELAAQKIVLNTPGLAEELEAVVEFEQIECGAELIKQDDEGTDVYFILAGSFNILVNGRKVASRGKTDIVGEMAAIELTQKRSSSVVADEVSVVAKVSAAKFNEIADKYPSMYRFVCRQLAQKLLERNKLVGKFRDKIKIFIISSKEALHIARGVQTQFERDPFEVDIWIDDVFRIGGITVDDLERKVDDSDFAIAIAHADDTVVQRENAWAAVRDNVIFELGMFMGRLGRERAILLEPRDDKVYLPSDLKGITTVSYSFGSSTNISSVLGPACNKMREHFQRLGAFNG